MRRLMTEHPEISKRLVIALGRRLREMNERLSRQSFQTVQSRVAVVLSELVAQELAEGAASSDVLVTATQSDLAQLAGSSRESASRFLAVLERAGVISQGRGRLVVHNPMRSSSMSSRRVSRRAQVAKRGCRNARRPGARRARSPPAAWWCATSRSW